MKPSEILAFKEALNGEKGELDAWLECNDESEVRAAINSVIETLRAKVELFRKQNMELTAERDALLKEQTAWRKFTVEADRTVDTAQAQVATLKDFVRRLIGVAPDSVGQCSGYKCREPYCMSCCGEEEAEAYLQTVFDLCHEALEVLAATQQEKK